MLAFLFALQIIFWLILVRHFIGRVGQLQERIIFSAGLMLKILAGCGVGWLYMYYYEGGDTLGYYHDAYILSDIFKENPYTYLKATVGIYEVETLQYNSQSRALFFAKIASLISIFSLQNYWLIAISFSMLNFFASWWLVMKLRDHFNINRYALFVSFLFYPSVVFWSSGLLKESVALAMIYILCGVSVQIYKQVASLKKINISLFLSLPCAWVLWMLKYYYAAILLPMLLLVLLYTILKERTQVFSKPWKAWMVAIPFLSVIFLTFMHLHPNLNPDLILKAIVRNHDLSVAASDEGDYVHYQSLVPTMGRFIVYFPKAVFSGLFRPLPGEGNSWFHLLAGFENLWVLGVSLFALFQVILKKGQLHVSILLVACILYVVLLAGLIALASPNFGSLTRYKVAYAPFWVCLCLLAVSSSHHFNKRSQSIKKI